MLSLKVICPLKILIQHVIRPTPENLPFTFSYFFLIKSVLIFNKIIQVVFSFFIIFVVKISDIILE